MAKRKHDGDLAAEKTKRPATEKNEANGLEDVDYDEAASMGNSPVTIQVITGSYDRILHGITATSISRASSSSKAAAKIDTDAEAPPASMRFADTFLFNAHDSAIRCLALSPLPQAEPEGEETSGGTEKQKHKQKSRPKPKSIKRLKQKVLLATGSTDERINIYSLSAHPPSAASQRRQAAGIGAAAPRPILEGAHNREVGALLHHAAAVTRLAFPTRAKLLSAAEDCAVAVTRTRDWSLLSTVRCPVPKAAQQGRPSGDTAGYGAVPSGVNDFAVHPSLRVMITVGKGERCMRLWNLVTGKKAGVLNFGREVLVEMGEGRHATGEGRRVVWGAADGADEFVVGFERNAVVFGMDSRPRCKVMRDARTKLHEFAYVAVDDKGEEMVLAVSTEDGRVLFFSTKGADLEEAHADGSEKNSSLPACRLVAQVGHGQTAGGLGRIKAFKLLPVKEDGKITAWYVVCGSSDGKIRIWQLEPEDLRRKDNTGEKVGRLLGTYETNNRITCLEAFVMIPRPEGAEESDGEDLLEDGHDGSEDSEDEDDQ